MDGRARGCTRAARCLCVYTEFSPVSFFASLSISLSSNVNSRNNTLLIKSSANTVSNDFSMNRYERKIRDSS